MTLFRRMLLLIMLMFWQGGFMFYGGVVVPVGSSVLGSHRAQSRITQPVTNYLNAIGGVALLVWGWELLAQGSAQTRRRRAGLLWAVLVVLLLGQVGIHFKLDESMAVIESMSSAQLKDFRLLHQGYLLVSTLQWLGSLGLLYLTLKAWNPSEPG